MMSRLRTIDPEDLGCALLEYKEQHGCTVTDAADRVTAIADPYEIGVLAALWRRREAVRVNGRPEPGSRS
ncbi:MAG TPA: hypothetical protein VJQ25_04390 [Nitrospira sp.]|nr:hypothetical protein [Nitrospira sp.]